jgi:hypothetical protein
VGWIFCHKPTAEFCEGKVVKEMDGYEEEQAIVTDDVDIYAVTRHEDSRRTLPLVSPTKALFVYTNPVLD